MKRSTLIKLVALCILLIPFGIFSLMYFGHHSTARTGSDRSLPDLQVVDIGFSDHPFSIDTDAIRLRTVTGEFVRLEDYRGKVVFLNFWASWCPTCIAEMPAMEKLHRKLKGKNFVMLAVNIKESASRVETFFENNKLTFTALLDPAGEAGAEFGLRAIPTTFILDKSGNIIDRIAGVREWGSDDMVTMFEQLAGG